MDIKSCILLVLFGNTWLPLVWIGIGVLFGAVALVLLKPRRPDLQVVAVLGGLRWTRNQFCRGWLITGDTGSGKTSSGINQLAHQVFQHQPKWGGLCIDEKGLYWETLEQMAQHYGRSHDLVRFQLEPGNAPSFRFNLIGDRSIPFSTYARFVVDTATSLGQGGDKGFFKTQAHAHIARVLELLYELRLPITLPRALELLMDDKELSQELANLDCLPKTPERASLSMHFRERYQSQPPEQFGGVRETIGNYLQYFVTPEVAQVFSSEDSTISLSTLDQGKIFLVSMPQKFQSERRYINTFLKFLFYTHALRRFDKPKHQRAKHNLLILWADEAQRFMTASEDGMSDYNCVDVIREAGATIIAATQSSTSLLPPLGQDKARVLTLNLRNRIIFRSSDELDATQSADFLGKRQFTKRTWGYTGDKRTVNYTEVDEYRVKPHQIRKQRDHQCILVHCERGYRQVVLPPLEPDGGVAPWYRKRFKWPWIRR